MDEKNKTELSVLAEHPRLGSATSSRAAITDGFARPTPRKYASLLQRKYRSLTHSLTSTNTKKELAIAISSALITNECAGPTPRGMDAMCKKSLSQLMAE